MSRARRTSRTSAPVLLLVLAALLGVPALLAPPSYAEPAPVRPRAATTTAATAASEPLTVTLTSLSPASIPEKGAITISGTVSNGSPEEWDDVNLAPFVSAQPITTRDDLTLAAATDSNAAVGTRLTDPVQTVGSLLPGASAAFTLRVPVASLGISGEPGVYWIGVHALGADADGRDLVADGRARSFIPLLPTGRLKGEPTPVSVVLSLRERVRRDPLGRVNGPSRWGFLTSEKGRLTRLVGVAASAGAAPLTWVVDPAVLDALDDLGRGNPALSLGGTQRRPEEPAPSDTASPSPAPSPAADDDPSVDEATRTASAQVLEAFLASARGGDLLTVGYADPDVVAVARQHPTLLARADSLAERRLAARGLEATRTVAPPDGYLDPTQLPALARDALLLLSDQGKERRNPPSTRMASGQELVLSDARASSGGPAPTRRYDALAVRQRVLCEAALEQLHPSDEGQPRPMVVQLPARWDPGPAWREADLVGTLGQARWIRLAPLPRGASTTYDGTLAYGSAQRAEEISTPNLDATRALVRTGVVLGHLLANDNTVTDTLIGAALATSSYSARDGRRGAVDQAQALDATAHARLDKVTVSLGGDLVTLSGGSGSLTVTIVNGLRQPVTVGLRARSDSPDVRIRLPDPVDLGPGERVTRQLPVTSKAGVHEITLQPVTTEGEEAGTPTTFSLRTSQVGRLIWFILAGGGVLLAVMIARRIVLRIRDHRWRRAEARG